MASNVFQHTDSIFANAVENPGESNDAALDLEPMQTHHDDNHSIENKLVGVVSDNPFASTVHSAPDTDGLDVDFEAAEARDHTYANPAVDHLSHPVAKESESPGADENAFPDNVDPLDTSLSGGSNINCGHSERGTDISMRPQSFTEQSESRQHDDPRKPAEETPRIAFATSDHVDSAYKTNLQNDRRATVRRDTMSNGHDFSGKISLSRKNSVVSIGKEIDPV
jgi:hypothetical protein